MTICNSTFTNGKYSRHSWLYAFEAWFDIALEGWISDIFIESFYVIAVQGTIQISIPTDLTLIVSNIRPHLTFSFINNRQLLICLGTLFVIGWSLINHLAFGCVWILWGVFIKATLALRIRITNLRRCLLIFSLVLIHGCLISIGQNRIIQILLGGFETIGWWNMKLFRKILTS